MNRQIQVIRNDEGTLAEDARELIAATAGVAEEKVVEARKRLGIALDGGKKILGRVRDKTVEGARAADKTVHEHPYEAIGIAFGVGALLGCLLTFGVHLVGQHEGVPPLLTEIPRECVAGPHRFEARVFFQA